MELKKIITKNIIIYFKKENKIFICFMMNMKLMMNFYNLLKKNNFLNMKKKKKKKNKFKKKIYFV